MDKKKKQNNKKKNKENKKTHINYTACMPLLVDKNLETSILWQMNLPPDNSRYASTTRRQNLADKYTLADGPPHNTQQCLK